jgi:hypothetical protein
MDSKFICILAITVCFFGCASVSTTSSSTDVDGSKIFTRTFFRSSLPSDLKGKVLKIEVPGEGGQALEELIRTSLITQGYQVSNGDNGEVKIYFNGYYLVNGYSVPLESIFRGVDSLKLDVTTGEPRIVDFSAKAAIMQGIGKTVAIGDPATLVVGSLVSLFTTGIVTAINNSTDKTIKPCETCTKKYRISLRLQTWFSTGDSKGGNVVDVVTQSDDIHVLPILERALNKAFTEAYGADAPLIRFPKPTKAPEQAHQTPGEETKE